jgi:hypothetical protein
MQANATDVLEVTWTSLHLLAESQAIDDVAD